MENNQREAYRSVKAWIVQRGIKQRKLAESLDTTENYFNKKLNGTGPDFRLSEVRKLHEDFGIPVRLFFELNVPLKELNDKTSH